MNNNIENLYRIAQKKNRLIIGLMSGTSLDGLDVALCSFSGSGVSTIIEVLQFETFMYDEDFKKEVNSILGKSFVDIEKLTLLNPWIATQHAAIINSLLKKWNVVNQAIDIIASHGQTIYHAPKILHGLNKFANATLQLGDADHLATATGIITISDFRQKHIATGGEGAPLATYGDYLLFAKKEENRILLNIGGIANFTYLPAKAQNEITTSTDAGPGNILMDAYIQKHFPGKYFDEDAAIALQGKINYGLLNALMQHSFFEKPFPKTTGAELFNLEFIQTAQQQSGTLNISTYDVMATLNKFSAACIELAIQKITAHKNGKMICSGGGIHNQLLMQHLQQALPNLTFTTTAEFNINPDAKEAVLFAVLANEALCGGNTNYNGNIPAISMGKISFPH